MMAQAPRNAMGPPVLRGISPSPSPRTWREKLSIKRFSLSNRPSRRYSSEEMVKKNNQPSQQSRDDSQKAYNRQNNTTSRGYMDDTQSHGSSVGGMSGDSFDEQGSYSNPETASTTRKQNGPRRGKRNASKRHTIDNAVTSIDDGHSSFGDPVETHSFGYKHDYDDRGDLPPANMSGPSPGTQKKQLSGLLTRFLSSKKLPRVEDGGSGDTCSRLTEDEGDIYSPETKKKPQTHSISPASGHSGTLPPIGPRSTSASNTSMLSLQSLRTTSAAGSLSSIPSIPSLRFRRSTMDSTDSSVPGGTVSPGANVVTSAPGSAASISSGGSLVDEKDKMMSSSHNKRGSLLSSATNVLASSRNLLQKQTSMVLPRRSTMDSLVSSNHGTTSVGGSAGMSGSIHRRRNSNGDGAVRRGSFSSGSISINIFGGSGANSTTEELPYELKQADLQKRAEDLHKCGRLDESIELWVKSLDLAEKKRESLVSRTEIICILMDLHFQLSEVRKREEHDRWTDVGMSGGSTAISRSSFCDSEVVEEEEEVKDPRDYNVDDSYHKMGYGDTVAPIPFSVTAARRRSSSSVSLGLDIDPVDIPPTSSHCVKRENSAFHRQAAKRYAHRLKPALVKSSWMGCSGQLMNFLRECEAWELALVVAEKVIQDSVYSGRQKQVDPQHLASIHFQVASQKLATHRQGEALQHLQATVKNLQQVSVGKRDMALYLQVLQLLASEYETQGMPKLALKAYAEELKHASTERQAHICCKMAEIFIAERQLDMALEQLELAAEKVEKMGPSDSSEDAQGAIRRQLLQTKGDIYFRLGRVEESMEIYQQALKESILPAEKAKLLYTIGRLCIRQRRTRDAITCFTRELEITQQELGSNHMSVSRIYHELAKLYDEGLGEHKMALMKYNKALQIELAVLQECQFAVASCQKCNPTTHRMCEMHANMHTSLMNQIRETKKCQGRMHFKLGDFDNAMKQVVDLNSTGRKRRGGSRRHSSM